MRIIGLFAFQALTKIQTVATFDFCNTIGQKRPNRNRMLWISAFHSDTHIAHPRSHVSFVPESDIGLAHKLPIMTRSDMAALAEVV